MHWSLLKILLYVCFVKLFCVLDVRSKLVAFLLVMSGDEFIPPLDAGAIVSQLKAYMDEKLQDIKPRDVDSEVPLKSITMKESGNQNQIDHQLKLLQLIEFAQKKFNAGKIDEVGTLLEDSVNAINKRVKLIRIADRREGGMENC